MCFGVLFRQGPYALACGLVDMTRALSLGQCPHGCWSFLLAFRQIVLEVRWASFGIERLGTCQVGERYCQSSAQDEVVSEIP